MHARPAHSTGRSSTPRIARWRASLDAFAASRGSAPSTHGDVDATCRALGARARRRGLPAPLRARHRTAARAAARRLALAVRRARGARVPRRARRLRVRDAGPRHRRDHARRQRGAARRAGCRRSRAARRSPRSRCPSPDAGSDAAAIAMTRARATATAGCSTASKTWISNGGIADFYCVFARTGEAPGAKGISAFVVPADAPGLAVAERYRRDRAASARAARVRRLPRAGRRAARRARARASSSRCARSTSSARRSPRPRSASRAARSTRRSRTRGAARCSARRSPTCSSRRRRSATWRPRSTRAALLTARAAWQRDTGGGGAHDARGRDGQARRDRGGAARRSTARVQLHGARGRARRLGRRAAVPRDPRAAHLRRRDRGAAADRRTRRAIARRPRSPDRRDDALGARRHVRARPAAAARAVARPGLRPARARVSRTGSTARPSCSAARSRAADGDRIAIRSPAGTRWTYRELDAQRQPDRARARRRPGRRAGQPRAAARPQHADDGGLLVRDHQGRRRSRWRRCRCSARRS